MVERWKIFEALDKGLSQRDVAKTVPCSIVTATRGAKVYRENKETVKKYLKLVTVCWMQCAKAVVESVSLKDGATVEI